MTCERTQELAAELALGIADGAERAEALRHLAECADCRQAVEELAAIADELLMLAPQHEPPPGFESRVLARLQPSRATPRGIRRRWRAPLAAAAVAAVAATAVVLDATSADRRLADHYRATLATAHGSSFEAARLRSPAKAAAGVVYAYRGSPSWIFVAVYRPYRSMTYTVELVMSSGRHVRLPALRIDPRTGSTGQTIPIDVHLVSSVRLIGPTPRDVLDAPLPHRENGDPE